MKPLTARMREAVLSAQSTFDGEERIETCHGGTANGLRARGLATGKTPSLYLTDAGKTVLQEIEHGQA